MMYYEIRMNPLIKKTRFWNVVFPYTVFKSEQPKGYPYGSLLGVYSTEQRARNAIEKDIKNRASDLSWDASDLSWDQRKFIDEVVG